MKNIWLESLERYEKILCLMQSCSQLRTSLNLAITSVRLGTWGSWQTCTDSSCTENSRYRTRGVIQDTETVIKASCKPQISKVKLKQNCIKCFHVCANGHYANFILKFITITLDS